MKTQLLAVIGEKELRPATEGLLTGLSHGLIRDRIRVTLATHFSNEE
jgi:hypothetical protein